MLCFGNEATKDRYVCRSVGLLVGLSVSTQISKKFGDIGWATVQTMKRSQRPGCSQDNCKVQCTVHVCTQWPPILPPRRLLGLRTTVNTDSLSNPITNFTGMEQKY